MELPKPIGYYSHENSPTFSPPHLTNLPYDAVPLFTAAQVEELMEQAQQDGWDVARQKKVAATILMDFRRTYCP